MHSSWPPVSAAGLSVIFTLDGLALVDLDLLVVVRDARAAQDALGVDLVRAGIDREVVGVALRRDRAIVEDDLAGR